MKYKQCVTAIVQCRVTPEISLLLFSGLVYFISIFFLQLLKHTAEAKIQVKLLKEQETDMKAQVNLHQIIHITIVLSDHICAEINTCFFCQLSVYSEKFDEFQGTVSKSHNVYASFKQDMDKVCVYEIINIFFKFLIPSSYTPDK